jgi:hypothetical protein
MVPLRYTPKPASKIIAMATVAVAPRGNSLVWILQIERIPRREL